MNALQQHLNSNAAIYRDTFLNTERASAQMLNVSNALVDITSRLSTRMDDVDIVLDLAPSLFLNATTMLVLLSNRALELMQDTQSVVDFSGGILNKLQGLINNLEKTSQGFSLYEDPVKRIVNHTVALLATANDTRLIVKISDLVMYAHSEITSIEMHIAQIAQLVSVITLSIVSATALLFVLCFIYAFKQCFSHNRLQCRRTKESMPDGLIGSPALGVTRSDPVLMP